MRRSKRRARVIKGKRKGLLAALIFFGFAAIASAEVEVEWEKTFGGSSYDIGYSLCPTSDGGYVITGYCGSDGGDVYLVKIDAEGTEVWEKTFGGEDSDWGTSVRETSDGGYIIVGGTYSYGAGAEDIYLIKTNVSGDLAWKKVFGGVNPDWGSAVRETSDGGYIIAGGTYSYGAGKDDLYLLKTDAQGNKVWEKTFGGSDEDWGNSVCESPDGGYLIAGYTEPFGADSEDVYLIKTDAQGNKEWEKTFGGTDDDWAHSLCPASDGGYIIAGGTYSSGAGSKDIYLLKINASGNREWEKAFGGSFWDDAHCVRPTTDGGYIVAGYTESLKSNSLEAYLIKIDAYGNKLWDKAFGGDYWDEAHSVQETTDGGYVIAGYTNSFGAGGGDVYLAKLIPGAALNQPPVADANNPYEADVNRILLDIDPNTLNLGSQGRWVTAYIREDPTSTADIQLDGWGSSDPDGDPLTYLWTITDPYGNIVETATGPDPVVTLGPGNYDLTLVVNDGEVDSESDLTTITVYLIDLAALEPGGLYLNNIPGEWGEFLNPELMVKFDRESVAATLPLGQEVEVVLSGDYITEARDFIRVIDRGSTRTDKAKDKAKAKGKGKGK
jgi:hypothetical protein